MQYGRGTTGNVIAALCSVFVPGLGQLIQGRPFLALFMFLAVTIGYALWWVIFIPAIVGGIIHLWSILDAALFRPEPTVGT